MKDISLVKLTALTADQQKDLLELLIEADMADLADGAAWLNDAVVNSVAAVGALESPGGRLVGFARALGDGVSDCYIQDVAVRRDRRGQHIGKALIELLLQELSAKNIDWVGLIATPGNADFYRKLGFEELKEHTPMRLKAAGQKKNL